MSTRSKSRSVLKSRATETRERKEDEEFYRDPDPQRQSRLHFSRARSQVREIDSRVSRLTRHSPESRSRNQRSSYDRNKRSQSVQCGSRLKRSCSQASNSSWSSLLDKKPYRDKDEKSRSSSRAKPWSSVAMLSTQSKNEEKPDLRSVLNTRRGSSSSATSDRISKDSLHHLNPPRHFPNLRERLQCKPKNIDKKHSTRQSDKPHTVTSDSADQEYAGIQNSSVPKCSNKIPGVVETFGQHSDAVNKVVANDPISLYLKSGSNKHQENTFVANNQVSLYQRTGNNEYQENTSVNTIYQVSPHQETGGNDYQENTAVTEDQGTGSLYQENIYGTNNQVSLYQGTEKSENQENTAISNDQGTENSEYQENTAIPNDQGTENSEYQENTVATNDQVSLDQGTENSDYQENTAIPNDQGTENSDYQENTAIPNDQGTENSEYQENTVATNDQVSLDQGTENSEYQENIYGTNNQVSLYQGTEKSENQENTAISNDQGTENSEYKENTAIPNDQGTENSEYQENTVATNDQVSLDQGTENSEYQENIYATNNQVSLYQGTDNSDYQENTAIPNDQGTESSKYQENTVATNDQVFLYQGTENSDYQENNAIPNDQVSLYQETKNSEDQENTVTRNDLVSPSHAEIKDTEYQENSGNSTLSEIEYKENMSHSESFMAELQNDSDLKADFEMLDEYIRVKIECETEQETENSPEEVSCTESYSNSRSDPDEHTQVDAKQEMGNSSKVPDEKSCIPKLAVTYDDLPGVEDVCSRVLQSNVISFNNELVHNFVRGVMSDKSVVATFQKKDGTEFDAAVSIRGMAAALMEASTIIESEISSYTTVMADTSSTNTITCPDGAIEAASVSTALARVSSSCTVGSSVEYVQHVMNLLERRRAVARFEKNTRTIVSAINETAPDVQESTKTITTQIETKTGRTITSSSMKNEVRTNTKSLSMESRVATDIRAAEQAQVSLYGHTNICKAAESTAQTPNYREFGSSNHNVSTAADSNDNRDSGTNRNICKAAESTAQTSNYREFGSSNHNVSTAADSNDNRDSGTNKNICRAAESTAQTPNYRELGSSNHNVSTTAAGTNRNITKAAESGAALMKIVRHTNENIYKATDSEYKTPNWDYRRSDQTADSDANRYNGRRNENIYKVVEPVVPCKISRWDVGSCNENVHKHAASAYKPHIPIWDNQASDPEYSLLNLGTPYNQDQRASANEFYGGHGINPCMNDRQTYGQQGSTSRQDQYMRRETETGYATDNRCKSIPPNFTHTNQDEFPMLPPSFTCTNQTEVRMLPPNLTCTNQAEAQMLPSNVTCTNQAKTRMVPPNVTCTNQAESWVLPSNVTCTNQAKTRIVPPNVTCTNQAESWVLPSNVTCTNQAEAQMLPHMVRNSATRKTEGDYSYKEPVKASNDPRSDVNISCQPVRYPQIPYPLPFKLDLTQPPPPPPLLVPFPPPSPPAYARPCLYPRSPCPASNFKDWERNNQECKGNNLPTPVANVQNWDRTNHGYKGTSNIQCKTTGYYNTDFVSSNTAAAAPMVHQSNDLDRQHGVEKWKPTNYKAKRMPLCLPHAAQFTLNRNTAFQPRQLGQPPNKPDQSVDKSPQKVFPPVMPCPLQQHKNWSKPGQSVDKSPQKDVPLSMPCPLQQQENSSKSEQTVSKSPQKVPIVLLQEQQERFSETLPDAVKPQKRNKAGKRSKNTKDSTTTKNKFKKLIRNPSNMKIPTELQFIYGHSMKNKLPSVKIPKIPKPKIDETTPEVDTEAHGDFNTNQSILPGEEPTKVVVNDKSNKVKVKRQPKNSQKCSSSESPSDTVCAKKPRKEQVNENNNILKDESSSKRSFPNTRGRKRAEEARAIANKRQNNKKVVTFSEQLQLEDWMNQSAISPQPTVQETASSNQLGSQLTFFEPEKLYYQTKISSTNEINPSVNGAENVEAISLNEIDVPPILLANTTMPTAKDSVEAPILLPVTHAETSMPTVNNASAFVEAIAGKESDNFRITLAEMLIPSSNEGENIEATSNEFSRQELTDAASATLNIMPDGLLDMARQAMQKLPKPAQKCKALLELVKVVKTQQNKQGDCHRFCEQTEQFLINSIEALNEAEDFPDIEASLMRMITRSALKSIAIIILTRTSE